MLTAIIEHLWQSTVIAAGAAVLALALRNRGAHVRYWVWFGASMKFLIPFALLVAIGQQIGARTESLRDSTWAPVARQWLQPLSARGGSPDRALSQTATAATPPATAAADGPAAASVNAASVSTRDDASTPAEAGRASDGTGTVGEARARPAAAAANGAYADTTPSEHAEGSVDALADQPALTAAVSAETHTPSMLASPWLAVALLAVWLLGSSVVATVWCRRWLTLAALARNAEPLHTTQLDTAGLEIRVTPATLEPGVFGIVRPVLLLPAGIAERLSRAELESIVRHERVHVARHDNLTALLHMLVEAAFWFHPLVWYIGKRLVDERERACDEAVLAAGVPAKTYAAGILGVCDAYLTSPLRCAAGVGGGVLETRVARILANYRPRPLARHFGGALIVLPAMALALPIAIGLLNVPAVVAQPAESEQALRNEASGSPPVNLLPLFLSGLTSASGNGVTASSYSMGFAPCHVFADLSTVVDGEDFGPPPDIRDFEDLVRYAYAIERDELVWPQDPGMPTIQVRAPSNEVPIFSGRATTSPAVVRHAACREMLSTALEQAFALEMRRDGNRWIVDRIDVPRAPSQPGPDGLWTAREARSPAPAAAVLDAYAGYYELSSDLESPIFAPFFVVSRLGRDLVLDWGGYRFTLDPLTDTTFLSFGRQRIGGLFAHFVERRDGRVAVVVEPFGDVPAAFATRIDAADTAEHVAAIERRSRERTASPGSRELVEDVATRFTTGNLDGNDRAAEIARYIRGALDAWRPGAFETGTMPRVELADVLPSSRDVFNLHFADAAVVRIDVVTRANDTAGSVGVDGLCRDTVSGELVPCVVRRLFRSEPGIETQTRGDGATAKYPAAPSVFGGEVVGVFTEAKGVFGNMQGPGVLLVSLAGCPSPDSDAAREPTDDVGPVPAFGSVSGVVAYAYALPVQALVWPANASDPEVRLIEQVNDRRASRIVRHSECRAFLRRVLTAEIGLAGRFESGPVRQWELTVDTASSHLGDAVRRNARLEPQVRRTRDAVYAKDVDMARFAEFLSVQSGEPVLDRTALTEVYDFSFVWQAVRDDAPDKRERELEAMRAELRSWWGLVLRPTQVEMTRLIVEHVEPPPVRPYLPSGWLRR